MRVAYHPDHPPECLDSRHFSSFEAFSAQYAGQVYYHLHRLGSFADTAITQKLTIAVLVKCWQQRHWMIKAGNPEKFINRILLVTLFREGRASDPNHSVFNPSPVHY